MPPLCVESQPEYTENRDGGIEWGSEKQQQRRAKDRSGKLNRQFHRAGSPRMRHERLPLKMLFEN
jgi:hypothetical protein